MSRRPRIAGENKLGQAMRVARAERDLSQAKVAAEVGYSRAWIAALERSETQPTVTLDFARRLNEILGIPLNIIVPGAYADMGTIGGMGVEDFPQELRDFIELALWLKTTPNELLVLSDLMRHMHRWRVDHGVMVDPANVVRPSPP